MSSGYLLMVFSTFLLVPIAQMYGLYSIATEKTMVATWAIGFGLATISFLVLLFSGLKIVLDDYINYAVVNECKRRRR